MAAYKINIKGADGRQYTVTIPDGTVATSYLHFRYYPTPATPGGAGHAGWNVLDSSGSYIVAINDPMELINNVGRPAPKWLCRYCKDTGMIQLLNGTAKCTECPKGKS